jgi:hypothetical protein
MKKLISPERIGLTVGLLTSLGLIAYFMIMKALGLAHIIELRFFNIIIMAIGIISGIVYLKHRTQEHEFYLKGLGEGMLITVIATVIFSIFITVYLKYIDTALMEEVNKRAPYTMDTMSIYASVFLEGLASGAIITFSAMQYLKRVGTFKAEPE